MANTLHITNGDSAVHILKQAGIPGMIIPWRDVLHDGPVPGDLPLDELTEVRAEFIARLDWGNREAILDSFRQRNETLKRCRDFNKTVLWFEHDLYDQLQLIQILDWFCNQPDHAQNLSLVQTKHYLGMASSEDIQIFSELETPVTSAQLKLAQQAWSAYRSSDPGQWRALLDQDTSALPHLGAAVWRQLEEYPDASSHLPKTERVAMELIQQGEQHPGRLFGAWSQTEDPMFMGDWSFFKRLQDCMAHQPPLLQQTAGEPLDYRPSPSQRIEVTAFGQEVLRGDAKAHLFRKQSRWIGGVELSESNLWLWNPEQQTITKETQ